MFSQIRSAVEQLAQQQQQSSSPAKRATSNSNASQSGTHPRPENDTQRSPTNSLDEGRKSLNSTSPSQLAESALLNFRKNLISSRSLSPNPSQVTDKDNSRQARSLEDRLRASFTLGDASERTTPDASRLHTPGEVDPASVELPRSPPLLEVAFDPLGAQLSPSSSQIALSLPPVSAEVVQPDEKPSTPSLEITTVHPNDIEILQASPVASPQSVSLLQQPSEDVSLASDTSDQHNDSISQEPVPKPHIHDLPALQTGPRSSTPRPLSPFPLEDREPDVDKLQERLKLVEQRFTDVSTSFKRLQAEKRAADQVLKDLTSLESITDVEGLREHLENLDMKAEISTAQIKKLNGRIQQHDLRLEELRDTHRLETTSQSAQIERLQKQVSEAEALLKAGVDEATKQKAETEQLKVDLDKAKGAAKEEEEKRTKAISLLKTVRAKLVKVEKEKDDALKEVAVGKEKDKEEREKDHLDRSRLELDLERSKLEREREVTALRAQFERELGGVKDRLERENAARKGQSELEAITTKAAHAKEIAAKTSRVAALESTIRALSQEKDNMFDQLQMRQAEVESSQSHLDSVEAHSKELQFQLRESEDRIEVLTEELGDINRKVANGHSPGGFSSAEEVARLLSETEGKYEARIGDLRSKLRALEKERHEAEDEWSRNLQERSRELDRLRGIVEGRDREYAESVRGKAEMEARVLQLETENRNLRGQTEAEQGVLLGLQKEIDWLKEAETTIEQGRDEALARLEGLQRQLEELQARETASKAINKTLREELRKVQSSAALLERQRNPGIGYWGTSPRMNAFTQSAIELQSPEQTSRSSVDESSTTSSPRPSSPTLVTSTRKEEEEVNLEYLRNVILQFLEHKEMRPNLVRVLSIILHFTPQETRRLIAKV